MKISDVPQDRGMITDDRREICYAVDEKGNYVLAESAGWEPKNVANSQAWDIIRDQARETLKNIEAILNSVDIGKDSIAKLTVFVKNLDDFQSVNKAFENFFNGIDYPARSTVEVSELPMGALIEIECIAIK